MRKSGKIRRRFAKIRQNPATLGENPAKSPRPLLLRPPFPRSYFRRFPKGGFRQGGVLACPLGAPLGAPRGHPRLDPRCYSGWFSEFLCPAAAARSAWTRYVWAVMAANCCAQHCGAASHIAWLYFHRRMCMRSPLPFVFGEIWKVWARFDEAWLLLTSFDELWKHLTSFDEF